MLASLLLAAALPPLAAQDQRDLNCLAVFALASTDPKVEADPTLKQGMASNFMYYLGKLDGRNPDFTLTERLNSVLTDPNFTGDQLRSEQVRCGQEMVQRGEGLKRTGQALMNMGRGGSERR